MHVGNDEKLTLFRLGPWIRQSVHTDMGASVNLGRRWLQHHSIFRPDWNCFIQRLPLPARTRWLPPRWMKSTVSRADRNCIFVTNMHRTDQLKAVIHNLYVLITQAHDYHGTDTQRGMSAEM